MGENNCAWNRQLTLSRETIAAAAAIYKGIFYLIVLVLYLLSWKCGVVVIHRCYSVKYLFSIWMGV